MELTDHFEVAASPQAVWDFFATAKNLPAITPPWLGFKILTPDPIAMGEGALLDYTIRWCGIPIKWRTRITDWSPPHQFIDIQIRGPYTLWHHHHTFAPSSSGVICRDRALYMIPFGIFGTAVNALVVQRQLLEIFSFRRRVIGEKLGWIRGLQDAPVIERLS
ncbi:hypothetical protein BH09SUM1_BH09SUM1_26640 [soil metagenome]